jgi:branched-chain amino acid transport system ATP-binding protein
VAATRFNVGFDIIEQVNRQGTTIFVVEQSANMALSIADAGYVLQTGSIVLSDTARSLLENPQMRRPTSSSSEQKP